MLMARRLGFGTLFTNIILLWIRNFEKNRTTPTPKKNQKTPKTTNTYCSIYAAHYSEPISVHESPRLAAGVRPITTESFPVPEESESENLELLPRWRSASNWGVLTGQLEWPAAAAAWGEIQFSDATHPPQFLNFFSFRIFDTFFSVSNSMSRVPLVHFIFCVDYPISRISICHRPVFYATGGSLLLVPGERPHPIRGRHTVSFPRNSTFFSAIRLKSLAKKD